MAAARRDSGHQEGLGCLVGFVAFLALLASIFGYYATLSEVQSAFDFEASSITLVGLPGTTVKFSLTGTSVGAFWASKTGLRLQLADRNSGFNETFAVTPAQSPGWADSITVCVSGACPDDSYSDGQFSVPARFTIPSSVAQSGDRTLSGTLAGALSYPENLGDASFDNVDTQVSIPVVVRLGAAPGSAHKLAELGVLISGGVFVVSLIVTVNLGKRNTQRRLAASREKNPSSG